MQFGNFIVTACKYVVVVVLTFRYFLYLSFCYCKKSELNEKLINEHYFQYIHVGNDGLKN